MSELFMDDEDETNKKIKLAPSEEIENLFNQEDLFLIDPAIKLDKKKTTAEIIGEKREVIFSRIFYQKVESGEIKIHQLNSETVKNFEDLFKWIEQQFSSSSNI